MAYPALLPLMRTPRLLVIDRTDAPADLNELVRFAERRNLVSARVPSNFERSLLGILFHGCLGNGAVEPEGLKAVKYSYLVR
jgi:hypothetical protein